MTRTVTTPAPLPRINEERSTGRASVRVWLDRLGEVVVSGVSDLPGAGLSPTEARELAALLLAAADGAEAIAARG